MDGATITIDVTTTRNDDNSIHLSWEFLDASGKRVGKAGEAHDPKKGEQPSKKHNATKVSSGPLAIPNGAATIHYVVLFDKVDGKPPTEKFVASSEQTVNIG